MTDVGALLAGIAGLRLCIVGDLLLDVYESGRVERVSPEAPVPVVIHEETIYRASGVATAAQSVTALCGRVQVVTTVGDDEDGGLAVRLLEESGARPHVIRDRTRCTPRKTRILAAGQHLVRLDREMVHDLDPEHARSLTDLAVTAVADADAVLISDYAKGVCTPGVVRAVIAAAGAAGIPVVVDPKFPVPDRYAGATAITPNRKEMREFARYLDCAGDSLEMAAARLRDAGGFAWVVVTQDMDGMTLVGPDETLVVPAYAAEVVDVSGAGDAAAATLALCLGSGAPAAQAALVSSLVAGLALRNLSHKRVTRAEVLAAAARFGLADAAAHHASATRLA
jgi:D-beta-D-heptose 7-phosphate kinase / D-beta-D-heptose 1-phosphate adenosyltransferase